MINKIISTQRSNIVKQIAIIAVMFIILIAIITAINIYISSPEGKPIQLGLANDLLAYCTFAVSESNASYNISLADRYEDLVASFNRGDIDASILPSKYIDKLDNNEFSIIAVTSSLNLVAIENSGMITNIYELTGHQVILDDSIIDTPELTMLNMMLSHANITVNLIFENDISIQQRVKNSNFDIMIVPVEKCSSILTQSSNYRSAFDLATQWTMLFNTQPPAGSIIILRRSCIEEKSEEANNLLSAIESTVTFLNTKPKKAALFITTNGFSGDPQILEKSIKHSMFVYLVGQDMNESLTQFESLQK